MERMGAWKAREEYSKTRPLIVLERNPQRTEERSEGSGNTLTRQKLAATRPGKRGRGEGREKGVFWGQSRPLLDTIKQTCAKHQNDPMKPPRGGGSADWKSIDVIRHKVEKRPQKSMRGDAPNSADTKPPIQSPDARH